MMKFLAVLIIAGMGVAIWFVWHTPPEDEAIEAEPVTNVAVRIAQVTRVNLRARVTAYGTVVPEPAGTREAASVNVAPSVAGLVVVANCVEGQQVSKGELLFQLDSRAADLAADFAEKAVQRERLLLEIEGTSEKALQQAELDLDAARVQQALLRVEAPLSGTVMRVGVRPGEAVDQATVMAEIVDLTRLVVSARVPVAELTALESGQPVEITADNGAAVLAGELGFVSPRIDAQNGTAEVRVRLPADSSLRPGQFARIRIVSAQHMNVLAVPVASVVSNEDGESVIAVVEGSMARQRLVTTGIRDGDLVEIAGDGLRAGMNVVTEGAYALPAETQVHVISD